MYTIKVLSVSVLVALVLGFGGGYWMGKGGLTAGGSANTLGVPGGANAPVTETLAVNGIVSSVSGSKITLDSGWVINMKSGSELKYPSGTTLAVGDIKPGMQISGMLNSAQKPGSIDSSALKSITVLPANTGATVPGATSGSAAPAAPGEVSFVNGVITKVSGNAITLDSGWTLNLSGNTDIRFPSGTAVPISNIKVNMSVNAQLNNPQKPGEVSASNIKTVTVVPSAPAPVSAPPAKQ